MADPERRRLGGLTRPDPSSVSPVPSAALMVPMISPGIERFGGLYVRVYPL